MTHVGISLSAAWSGNHQGTDVSRETSCRGLDECGSANNESDGITDQRVEDQTNGGSASDGSANRRSNERVFHVKHCGSASETPKKPPRAEGASGFDFGGNAARAPVALTARNPFRR